MLATLRAWADRTLVYLGRYLRRSGRHRPGRIFG